MNLRPCITSGLVLIVLLPTVLAGQTRSDYDAARQKLVEEVITVCGVKNRRVLKAMLDTPRHEFVPPAERPKAYFDMALPIGEQQTISSPFIVAYMTESLDPQPTDRVLEIGTGSGYQAAVLAPLVKEVFTIEIVSSLGRRAAQTLRRLGYDNVQVKVGDGYQGWPEHAPFDKIIVTCSPEKVPLPLFEQLREGGLMVVPVGERYQQTLYLLRKRQGKLEAEALRPTLFVPMTGQAESQRRVKPDPLHPSIVNGGFEEPVDEGKPVPGWYYQRQVTLETDRLAPEGNCYVKFTNETPGRASHLLQGLAVDGRQVVGLRLSAWVKTENAIRGHSPHELPMVGITFYDERRAELGNWWLGPWEGTERWHQPVKNIRVPHKAREAIVRIGLFGAIGEACFDVVKIERIER
jgi:protein-L-isoaspartate(D-aspartate) O-methyltransferase